MANGAGLTVDADDLVEVTHRLNALLEALAPLGALPLDAAEPVPFNVAARSRSSRRPSARHDDARRRSGLHGSRQACRARARQAGVPVELVRLYLDRIDRLDGRLRAWITVCREPALEAAHRAETAVMRGEALGPLHGVPVGVKDQFDTAPACARRSARRSWRTVSRPGRDDRHPARPRGRHPPRQAEPTESPSAATIRPPFGQRRNPWNLDHVPACRRPARRPRPPRGCAPARSARTPRLGAHRRCLVRPGRPPPDVGPRVAQGQLPALLVHGRRRPARRHRRGRRRPAGRHRRPRSADRC